VDAIAVDAIAESLNRHGQLRPAVVNGRDHRVLVGNHMLLGARKLGWIEIDVIWVDLDDDAARRLLLLDNRLSDVAEYDVQELLAMLSSVEDLDGTGYEQTDIDELLDGLAPPPLDENEVMRVPAEPITLPGEVIELGTHRLVCGDARDPQTYERLLGEERAGLLWTDPPYGVDYVGRGIEADRHGRLRAQPARSPQCEARARRTTHPHRRVRSPARPEAALTRPHSARCAIARVASKAADGDQVPQNERIPLLQGDSPLQRRGRDSNSRYANKTHNGFRDRRIQPLCHPSGRPELGAQDISPSPSSEAAVH
jgi:hypothetical protein